ELVHLGNRFAMLDAVRQYPERQRFYFIDRIFLSLPVDHHTGEIRHLGDPSAILLAFEIDGEAHSPTSDVIRSRRRYLVKATGIASTRRRKLAESRPCDYPQGERRRASKPPPRLEVRSVFSSDEVRPGDDGRRRSEPSWLGDIRLGLARDDDLIGSQG